MVQVEELKMKYPGAVAWQMGDGPEMASVLADLIKNESKRPPADLLPRTRRMCLLRGWGATT